jgi:hypothetical protein
MGQFTLAPAATEPTQDPDAAGTTLAAGRKKQDGCAGAPGSSVMLMSVPWDGSIENRRPCKVSMAGAGGNNKKQANRRPLGRACEAGAG